MVSVISTLMLDVSHAVEHNMIGPQAVTEALSTGAKTVKGPPAGTEALSNSNSVIVSINIYTSTRTSILR